MANLSREEMGQIIDRGESVFVRGADGVLRVVNSRAHLPSESDLASASGDPEKIKAAADAIDKQIASLQAAKSLLESPAPAPAKPEPAKAETKPETPKAK